ncbi:tyrosine-protein phosphatase [Woodsholea maritima]|uniref:tyrosine-protein phosphatase n=1 Tax=Woodsholea maritima TaxID=240237 RepID=UPI00035D22F7|nr:tyrosine-protein phosphatase [Woodsholea maritima]
MSARHTPLEGVHNFRTFGGYACQDGQLVDGLYRSGQFSRASQTDRATLEALGIGVVADLRRPKEREIEPSWWGEKAGVTVLASDHVGDKEPPHFVFLRESNLSVENIQRFMRDTYRRLPFDAGNIAIFKSAIEALAHSPADSGFIVHCAAGKDRTGLFCAFLKAELGVSYQDILDDYMMTNTAVDFDVIMPGYHQRIKTEFDRTMSDEAMRAFLGVEGEYLDAAFDEIKDASEYWRDAVGVSEADLAKLRERLVIKAG